MVAPSRSPTGMAPRSTHRPWRTSVVSGPRRLTRCSSMAMTPSATARVPAPGVMTIGMPRAVAAARSIRSTPTPVRAMTRSIGARSRNAPSITTSARAMAPRATARSSGPGSGTKVTWSRRVSATRAGSTSPSATTRGSGTIGGLGPSIIRSARGPVAERRARHLGHLLPGPTLGRRGGRGDDLGHGVGLLDGRVHALPACHRDQELLGLDDLQVVVAHGDARARLEPGVVPHVLVAQHGRVPLVRPAPDGADPHLVHPFEVPCSGAVGPVDLEVQAAHGSDDGTGGLQRPDGTLRVRPGGEADQSGGVVVVLHRAHLAVLDHGEVG